MRIHDLVRNLRGEELGRAGCALLVLVLDLDLDLDLILGGLGVRSVRG